MAGARASRQLLPGERLPLSEAEVQAQLTKILTSRHFVKSIRLSRFLRLAVERTLAGEQGSLKEFSVGRDVFDRRSDYDPRTDSIVRVEARRLRRKLAEYYRQEGRTDSVWISFRPGSYVPDFRWRVAHEQKYFAGEPALALDANMIAVLPFANLSPEPSEALFCEGTTEEVIHKLASVNGLTVLGLTTGLAVKESPEGPVAACRKLGAGTLIEGSVRRSGSRLRVTTKAVSVKTGRTLWSRICERPAGDIFSIQDEVAHKVATALHADIKLPVSRRSIGVEAYTSYLKGAHIWADGTQEHCLAAIEKFKKSVALAPEFALPHAGLAQAYQWMALWGWMRPRDAQRLSHHSASEAIRIDSDAAEGHACLAAALARFDWDWTRAMAEAGKAIELNPGCSLAYSIKANCALAHGRLRESVLQCERARQFDPLSSRTNGAIGIAYWMMEHYPEAEHWLRVAQRLDPQSMPVNYFLMRLFISTGRYVEALGICRATGAAGVPSVVRSAEAVALLGCGKRDEALAILSRLEQAARSEYVDPLAPAIIQIALGNLDRAFEYVRMAIEERAPMAVFSNVEPAFAPLRGSPRFAEVLRALRLD